MLALTHSYAPSPPPRDASSAESGFAPTESVPEHWHSPRSRSAAEAAAPARLAEQYNGRAVWRRAVDGTLEVATVGKGRLTRYLVHEDGTTTARESLDSSARYVLGGRLTWAGFALCLSIVISGAILAPGGASARMIFPAFLTGMALAWIGGTMRARHLDPTWLLRRLGESPADWHIPSRLGGWQPASSEQLAAVEELAESHEGVAYVRDDGGATIQAVVLRNRRIDSYWIDRFGNAGLTETLPWCFPGGSLARRVRKLPDGSYWIEVRTQPEPSND